MNLVLGAVMLIASVALLNLGRVAVTRTAASAPARAALVADVLAVGFTALVGPGFLLMLREVMLNGDALHVAGLGVALVAAVAGSRVVSRMLRRAEARRLAPVSAAGN